MLTRVPVWVFVVLALLVVVGLRYSRPRAVAPGAVAALALAMLGLSLNAALAAFGPEPASLLAWAAGMAASTLLGARVFGPRGLALSAATGRIHVPGSWLPLGLMLAMFSAKFVLGYAKGADLAVVHQTWFAAALCLSFGLLSGGFAARAIEVLRFAGDARRSAR